MSEISVCRTKRYFDTEFEATINAAKIEAKWKEEMEPYACGNHWHITHSDPSKRRGVGHDYARCPHCKKIFKRAKMNKHKCEVKERLNEKMDQSTTIAKTVQTDGAVETSTRILPLGQTSKQEEIEGF